MIVVEIALQGIKGFPELVRLGLRPGPNVAKPSDPALGAALIDAVYHTLFPDPARSNATAHLVMSRAERSRIAVTFFGRDRVTYRMIREADTGACKLYKFDQNKKQYQLFTDVAADAAQYVRVQQRLPDEVTYERLFVFAPQSMPSRKHRARTRSGAPLMSGLEAPSAPGMPSAQPFVASMMARPQSAIGSSPPRALSGMSGVLDRGFGSSLNVTNALVQSELAQSDFATSDSSPDASEPTPSNIEDKKTELARLRNELEVKSRADRAQDELDQLNMRKFELTEKVERVRRLQGEVSRLQQQADGSGGLDDLPTGFAERLRHYEELGAKYEDDRFRLQDEIGGLEALEKNHHIVKLPQDRYFLLGIFGAIGFFALAFALGQPLVALFNIAFALVAAGAAIRYISDLEMNARGRVKMTTVRDRLDRLERQHNLDTGATRRLMEKLDVDSPAELLGRVEGHEKLMHQKAIAQETLDSLLRDPEIGSATRELVSINKRVDVLETEVMSSAGSVLSVDTLEVRIDRLEAELRSGAPRRPASIVGTPISSGPPRAVPMRPPPSKTSVSSSDLPLRPVRARPGSIIGKPESPPTRDIPITEGTPIPSEPSQPAKPVLPSFPSSTFTPDVVAPSRNFSTITTAIDPREFSQSNVIRPKDPLARGPSIISSALPPTDPPPPKTKIPSADSSARSLFDFGGGDLADEDEDENGYGSGYGTSGGDSGSSSGGSSASGYQTIGFGGRPGTFGGAGGYGGDDGGGADRSRDLMQAAVDVLQVDVDQLGRTIERRLGQYLGAFTEGRYRGAEFGPRGELLVVPSDEGDPTAYPSLDDELMDLVDSALRFCLVETIVQEHRIPVLFDDPFSRFPAKKRKLLTQMLAYLGGATQVIVMSRKDDVDGHKLSW